VQTCLSHSQLSPRECTDARFGGCEPARRRQYSGDEIHLPNGSSLAAER
jgi:hypothetical protein